jgi:PAS domain S-box-containing protein
VIKLEKNADAKVANSKLNPLPLAVAIDQVADSIIITSVDGIVQFVNAAFETITGYSRSEVIGQSLSILKSGQHTDEFYRKIWDTIRKGEVWSGRIINRRKDGTLFEEDATISPLCDESHEVIHYVAVKRDVTHEIQLEKQLRQAQKMEAIGTLAGGIAHDFNNILTGIIGYVELAQLDAHENSSVIQNLEKVLIASHRAKDLVMQILAFSRQNELERKPIQISLVIREILKLLQATLPTTIEIRQNIGSETHYILADPSQIHQLLLNLCTNAAHAMEASGGILEVRTRAILLDDENINEFPELLPGCYLEMTVIDTGHGMNPNILERLFDPFFTTKEPTKGTGMGLAVVHGIVKRHMGAIRVQSKQDKGSEFRVVLPKLEGRIRPVTKKQEVLPGGNERILFIDDEESLVDLGSLLLERLGYQIETETDPLKALETFRRKQRNFDLIITDMTMPKMTGITLARKLIEIREDIPIVLTTGFSELIVEEKFRQMGIKALLMKPLTMKDLADTIRKVLE